jgi:hypothetical protein
LGVAIESQPATEGNLVILFGRLCPTHWPAIVPVFFTHIVSPRRRKAVVKAEHCHEEIIVHDNETVFLHTNGKVYFQFFCVKSWERHSKNKALVSIPYVYRSGLFCSTVVRIG